MSANGTINRLDVTPRKATRKTVRKPTTPRAARHRLNVAHGVSAVGVVTLGLSVTHCTQSLALLTHTPTYLAAMMATAIDAGLIAAECADIVTHGTATHKTLKNWAYALMGIAVVLSMVLNAIGSALHAEGTMKTVSYAIGAVIPVIAFLLFRIAGILYTAK
jgi:hypothetical protein